MNVFTLTIREIGHRKTGFFLGALSVVIAVAALVGEITLLDAHDLQTMQILKHREEKTREQMRILEDDYRKIMKELGFNLLILPKDQRLGDFYTEGYAARTMPEEYVTKLSNTPLMTIRHLLPCLEQKVRWKEQGNRLIILNGVRGEVPFSHRAPKEPMLIAVPPGRAALGFEIWNSLDLEKGEKIRILGREFTVDTRHPQRGNKDDITIWIDLDQAQELLDMEGRINAILALKCHCSGVEIESIQKEVSSVLPETNTIELSNKVTTRAKARDRAREAAEAAIRAEREDRARMRGEIEGFGSRLIPLVIIGCAAWIGLLSFSNVRERRGEIAILSAIGFRPLQILKVFLFKAVLMGIVGAAIGFSGGFIAGIAFGKTGMGVNAGRLLFQPLLFLIVIITAPLLCVMASLVPAIGASWENPAEIFSRE